MNRPFAFQFSHRQQGLTLIELLVAMVIGLVIVLAAVASLTVARTGFTAVDASSQLRDSGRFASDLIQRVGVQTGYRDVYAAVRLGNQDKTLPSKPASIGGFNSLLLNTTDPTIAGSSRSASDAGFGSDVLILRYQASQLYTGSTTSTKATVADQSMIDCAGNAVATVVDPNAAFTSVSTDNRIVSIFHVAISQGEPSLMCTYSATGVAPWTTVPVIQGVEKFQVLFGTDGVVAKTTTVATTLPDLPDRYLRADQIKVDASDVATQDNWRRVRSIRIGLVLRAAPGTAQGNATQTIHPFGEAASSAGPSAVAGSAFSSAADEGTDFTPTPDTRLRQAVTFTVHLRNDQGI